MADVDLSKHKSIFDVSFPIFALAKQYDRVWTEDNITKIQTPSGIYVLDNKNMKGDNLGQRRLRIKNSKLYIPRVIVQNIPQLINSTYKTYIDNAGEVFKYVKHKLVPLKYYKVRRVLKTEDGCVLYFKDLDNPIKVSCKSAYGIGYVGFLITKLGYIEYDYSEERKKDAWRKI